MNFDEFDISNESLLINKFLIKKSIIMLIFYPLRNKCSKDIVPQWKMI